MEYKVFTDANEAKKFIETNSIRVTDYEYKNMFESISKDLDMFNIEGFCKPIKIITFKQYIYATDNKLYWEYSFCSEGIEMLETKEIYRLVKNRYTNNKYEISLLPHKNSVLYKYKYENKKQPNFIGKATAKKISEWIEYIKSEYAFQITQYEHEKAKNINFANAFKNKYPNGRFVYNSEGWCTKFDIQTDVYNISFESGANEGLGNFYRKIEIRYDTLPSNEDLLK